MKIIQETKWQIYRPLNWIFYGWAFLVVDLHQDYRGQEETREELKDGWEKVKEGILEDDPNKTARGQGEMKTIINTVMMEAMK